MPQPSHDLTAADIRKILNEKFPATSPREKVYVSVTLALLEAQETLEAQVKGLATLFGGLCMALEVDPKQLLLIAQGQRQTTVEGDEGGSSGTAGMGGAGPGGAGSAGGGSAGGGGGAGPSNPIADKTQFPSGVAASAPPGTAQRTTVQEKKQAPAAAPAAPTSAEPVEPTEIPEPNVQSGPAMNARPNISNNGAKVHQ